MKRDCERAVFGVSNAKVAGDDATPREMGSFDTYIVDGWGSADGGGTPPTGNGQDTPTPGAATALTEEIMKNALEGLWNRSGGNENIIALCGSHNRGIISTFTASSTRYVTTDDRKLVASIDVYDGDFHTVTVTPDRYSLPDSLQLIDVEYAALADLRPISSKDLAVTGDSIRKEIVWETTIEICNPDAHAIVGGLTTA